VAVNAFLIFEEKFLFLKRATKPLIWAPPGGRLNRDEDPVAGLQREVFEETALQITVQQPVTSWFGLFYSSQLFSVDYLCTSQEGTVTLSSEHSEYRWLTIEQLKADESIYLGNGKGFRLSDFYLAWCTYLLNEKRMKDLERYLLSTNFL
jgi:8-oxo-dGTP pyrophosphatase MutT (NUDIX family)